MPRTAPLLRLFVLVAASLALAGAAHPADAPAPTPKKFQRPKPVPRSSDGMVRVPAGKFLMGCNEQVDEDCLDDEKPGKMVELKAYEIDATEVTVAQYAACVAAKKCSARRRRSVRARCGDGRGRRSRPGTRRAGARGHGRRRAVLRAA